tara:strand:+ start:104 stop:1390 length:1287 start_codon:yes stop_codon:yes gene_type:complete
METLGFLKKNNTFYFNEYTENYSTTRKLLVGKKLPLKQINDGTSSQFEFDFVDRRLYLINKNYKIPCSVPLKNRLLISVYYLPTKNDSLYIDESYYEGRETQIMLDVVFYVDFIKSIDDKSRFEFLENFHSFMCRTFKDDVFINRLIYEGGFDTHTKNKLFYKYNSLGIVSILLIQHNFQDSFDIRRLYHNISTVENDPFISGFSFSKNTYKIESEHLFFSSLFEKFPNLKSLVDFFEIDILRNSLNDVLNITDKTSFSLIPCIDKKVCFETEVLVKNEDLLKKTKKDYSKKIGEKLRTLENEYRLKKGHSVVGSMVNESILFQKIKDHFKNLRVVSQGSPSWLNRQRIDIYFPEINLGLEYQGIQHFKPIDYFGGVEGFHQTQERDKRKKTLCKKNGCILIFVLPDYNINDVIKLVEKTILNERLDL